MDQILGGYTQRCQQEDAPSLPSEESLVQVTAWWDQTLKGEVQLPMVVPSDKSRFGSGGPPVSWLCLQGNNIPMALFQADPNSYWHLGPSILLSCIKPLFYLFTEKNIALTMVDYTINFTSKSYSQMEAFNSSKNEVLKKITHAMAWNNTKRARWGCLAQHKHLLHNLKFLCNWMRCGRRSRSDFVAFWELNHVLPNSRE